MIHNAFYDMHYIKKLNINFDLCRIIFPNFTSRLVAFYIHMNKVDYQKAEVSKQGED